MQVSSRLPIPSVNFHLWQPCNMGCKFCFSAFQEVKQILPKGHLPKEQALALVTRLADYGFSKITFVGGEPTLCPWLLDLVKLAKSKGLITMVVSNGTHFDENYLSPFVGFLDWIVLSIDSLIPATNAVAGRKLKGKQLAPSQHDYERIIAVVKQFDFKFKINTVVHQYNKTETMVDFINKIKPIRWKIMQTLPIEGQNNLHIANFLITEQEFEIFIENNSSINVEIDFIPENNDLMLGSYLMVDPAGRFFDNINSVYQYSAPILEIGVQKALEGLHCDTDKFENRKGRYYWV